MPRRKNIERSEDPAIHKTPARVSRRRRRKPPVAKAQPQGAQGKFMSSDGAQDEYAMRGDAPGSMKMSRAPRPAEPPLPNPNVFSYTFTIWKSS